MEDSRATKIYDGLLKGVRLGLMDVAWEKKCGKSFGGKPNPIDVITSALKASKE
jgi:hypothetical protein